MLFRTYMHIFCFMQFLVIILAIRTIKKNSGFLYDPHAFFLYIHPYGILNAADGRYKNQLV